MITETVCRWCKMPIHQDVNGRWEHDHNGMFNCDTKRGTAMSFHIAKPIQTIERESDLLLPILKNGVSEGAN